MPSSFSALIRGLSTLALFISLSACGAARQSAPVHTSAPLGRSHALVDGVWSSRDRALVDPEVLARAVASTPLLLVGETHDNPDHHLLEAELTLIFLEAHPRARVAFEMLDQAQGRVLQAHEVRSSDELAALVRWEESGWPEFSQYRPIFERILEVGGEVVAAHPTREEVMSSMHGVEKEQAAALHLDDPLPPEQLSARKQEIIDSHCGHASESMVSAMENAQAFKDAYMARSMLETGAPTLLVAGRGHVRKDRGVPLFLARRGATDMLSVGLVEVRDDALRPSDYELAPYDFVVFTARTSDEDPCERFREQLEKMKRTHEPPAD